MKRCSFLNKIFLMLCGWMLSSNAQSRTRYGTGDQAPIKFDYSVVASANLHIERLADTFASNGRRIRNYGCTRGPYDSPIIVTAVLLTTGLSVQATTDLIERIEWGSEGSAVPNQRGFHQYSRTEPRIIHVIPFLRMGNKVIRAPEVRIWVIWGTVTNHISGPISSLPGALPLADYAGNGKLGEMHYNPAPVTIQGQQVTFVPGIGVAGRMVSEATLQPATLYRVARNQWQFRRNVSGFRYRNGEQTSGSNGWDSDDRTGNPNVIGDTNRLTDNDRLYFTDAPNIQVQSGVGINCEEAYLNFRCWVTFRTRNASATSPFPDASKWSYRARVHTNPPTIVVNQLRVGGQETPTNSNCGD